MSEPSAKVPRATPFSRQKTPPGPHGHLLLGSAPEIQRDPLRFCMTMKENYGDVSLYRFLLSPTFMVFHPDDIKHVLQENHQNYNKDYYIYKTLKPFFGQGLFTNNGQSWLHQRRLMQPAFHRKRLAAFGQLMTDGTLTMLERWQEFVGREQPLDIPAEMMRLTQRIVGQALFTVDLSNDADTVGQAFTKVSQLILNYMYAPFPPLRIPTPRNRRLQAAIRLLDTVVYDIIHKHRQQHTDTGDLLSMLLLARDEETGEGMNDQQVHDEVMTLLLAGHETTANALTWTWYLLSQHPHVQRRLHAELDGVLGGQRPAVEHLADLSYTGMVIEEAMRLYPPLWGMGRKVLTADEIGGYHIPKNYNIWLSPYVTHRHPDFWEDPEVFDPERFLPERSASRPRYAYFPFGGGPRLCLGSGFAMMEAQLILAMIAQHYRLQLIPGHPVEPEVLLTLRPRYGLPMTLHYA